MLAAASTASANATLDRRRVGKVKLPSGTKISGSVFCVKKPQSYTASSRTPALLPAPGGISCSTGLLREPLHHHPKIEHSVRQTASCYNYVDSTHACGGASQSRSLSAVSAEHSAASSCSASTRTPPTSAGLCISPMASSPAKILTTLHSNNIRSPPDSSRFPLCACNRNSPPEFSGDSAPRFSPSASRATVTRAC